MAAPAPKKSGMSLYAEYLTDQPLPSATISAAPIKYEAPPFDEFLSKVPKKKTGPLQFQPVKRPQASKKTKPKQPPIIPKIAPGATSTPSDDNNGSATASKLEPSEAFSYWVGDAEEDAHYEQKFKDERTRQRKMLKESKKKHKNKEPRQLDEKDIQYDKPYNLLEPTSYVKYRHSEEQNKEIKDWKDRLYAHRMKKDNTNADIPVANVELNDDADSRPYNRALPPGMSFAPPSFDNTPTRPSPAAAFADDDGDTYMSYSADTPFRSNAVSSLAVIPDDVTGEDAYARRMRLSAAHQSSSPAQQSYALNRAQSASSPANAPKDPLAAQAAARAIAGRLNATLARAQAPQGNATPAPVSAAEAALPLPTHSFQPAAPQVTDPAPSDNVIPPPPPVIPDHDQAPPPPPPPAEELSTTISREPVRYGNVQPTTPADSMAMEGVVEENPAPSRPKKMNIAEKIMMSQGWSKGQGLGARGEGITEALRLKTDKRKDGPTVAYIKGPKRQKVLDDQDDDTMPSEVIKIRDILVGVDIDYEIQENNLMQQIGDHFGEHGNIQRVAIWREAQGGNDEVLIKYTAPVSALKAVTSRDSRKFLGNKVKVTYFPAEKFEKGEYA